MSKSPEEIRRAHIIAVWAVRAGRAEYDRILPDGARCLIALYLQRYKPEMTARQLTIFAERLGLSRLYENARLEKLAATAARPLDT
jgi:hypothetical protein